jgi:hypothetical protein
MGELCGDVMNQPPILDCILTHIFETSNQTNNESLYIFQNLTLVLKRECSKDVIKKHMTICKINLDKINLFADKTILLLQTHFILRGNNEERMISARNIFEYVLQHKEYIVKFKRFNNIILDRLHACNRESVQFKALYGLDYLKHFEKSS